MLDLRFVIRDGKRVLQWRQVANTMEVVTELQNPLWYEWEDVRTEEEAK